MGSWWINMRMRMSLALVSLSALMACDTMPPAAYYTRGTPESLLNSSSEVVNLSIGTKQGVKELSSWVNRDQPTRAELYCLDSTAQCAAAREALELYGVPTQVIPSGENSAALIYSRVVARDCENRYIDNRINPYNLNHPTFGCSVAANQVQMVADKQQFVSPNTLDKPDSRYGVRVYRDYLFGEKQADAGIEDTVLKNLGSQ